MVHWSRLIKYGRRFLNDERYRTRVFDLIDRHASGASAPEAKPAEDDMARAQFLRGRKLFIAAGCELTFLMEYMQLLGVETWHSFDNGRPADPMSEVRMPGSRALRDSWDYYMFSVSQELRGVIGRVQLEGHATRARSRNATSTPCSTIIDKPSSPFVQSTPRRSSSTPILLVIAPRSASTNIAPTPTTIVSSRCCTSILGLYRVAREHPSVYVLDVDVALAGVAKEACIDPETSSGIYDHPTRAAAKLLGEHFVRHLCILEPSLRRIKCAVFDLDGTLWAGVLREDGPAGVAVREYYVDVLQQLAARGILLALCSKNDEVELAHLPSLLGDSLYSKIVSKRLSWKPKSQALREIAQELNIGLDSLAFFDDSEFERAEVKANAPSVLVLTPEDIFTSLNRVDFQPPGEITAESLARTDQYREQNQRQQAEKSLGLGHEDFLKSCQLKLEIRRSPGGRGVSGFRAVAADESAQRHAHTDLHGDDSYVHERARRIPPAHRQARGSVWELRDDRLCRLPTPGRRAAILDLAFSCRGAGRGVEVSMLNHLGTAALVAGARVQVIQFVVGPRNQQMLEILTGCGFLSVHGDQPSEGGTVLLRRLLPESDLSFPAWLSVTAQSPGKPDPGTSASSMISA